MRSSEIRRLMKLAADPSIISFAGGMPNNNLFPTDLVSRLYENLPVTLQQAAFQYGPTAGLPPLLEVLREYLKGRGLPVDDNELIITTGAQQGLNIMAKIFVDPGDTIVTEYPSFIGALAAFKSYGAKLVGVEMDEEGIQIKKLAGTLEKNTPKFLYVNPCFHNPAGIIYSTERKQALIELCREHEVCLLEDDPYSELYFDEADRELTVPIKSMARDSFPICYVGSFAKIFGPGMRLGWMLGPSEIIDKAELAKQSMDACSPSFTQVLAYAFLAENKLSGYLTTLRPTYRHRAQVMLDALEEGMPEGVHWTRPRGGFYVWVTLPKAIDSSEVFAAAIDKGAAFVIGSAFDPKGKRNNSFRLAFSHTPEDRIAKGTRIVCDAVKSVMER
jgi:DNA-binding transcriptional MocR family regulator